MDFRNYLEIKFNVEDQNQYVYIGTIIYPDKPLEYRSEINPNKPSESIINQSENVLNCFKEKIKEKKFITNIATLIPYSQILDKIKN